jgi:hypothetical protein
VCGIEGEVIPPTQRTASLRQPAVALKDPGMFTPPFGGMVGDQRLPATRSNSFARKAPLTSVAGRLGPERRWIAPR